jgi:type IV pilus assembly protein PilN
MALQTIIGYAQSNARVSTLMRNVEASPWLTAPELVEIKLVPMPGSKDLNQKINEFTLAFLIKRAAPVDAVPVAAKPGAPAKPATPDAGKKS